MAFGHHQEGVDLQFGNFGEFAGQVGQAAHGIDDGGTANCTVIISDEPIGAPVVARPDVAIVLNQPSYDKYEPLLKPGGLLIVNSDIVEVESRRQDIEAAYIPANTIAEEEGTSKMLNMAVVGAMLSYRPILELEMVERVITDHLPADKAHLIEANHRVLRRGFQVGEPALS